MSIVDHLRDGPAYLDYNATTPVDPEVVEAMLPYLTTHFGNPSSSHAYGRSAATAVAAARAQVAALIGAAPEEIVFTSTGSEANALALQGAMLPALRTGRNHLITQITEHPSVLETCEALKRRHGIWVTYLAVDEHGSVDPEALRRSVNERTALVSLQFANGETGTIHPIPQLADIAHEAGALFHTDAAQAMGKIPVDVGLLGVDLLTLVGHKFYAPKGIAALRIRKPLHLEPVISGGGQERAQRAGTENVAALVGLGAAAAKAARLLSTEPRRLAGLRDLLQRTLEAAFPGRTQVNGHPSERLPNTLNISVSGIVAADVLSATSEVAASTASACHSGTHRPSDVLLAMGHSTERALAAFRLSLGRWTGEGDVDRAARALTAQIRKGPDTA
ncbi:cysteine desulfurase family protein [Streptomyces chiangmaiensis]|uniref:Cysteine desulfurase family protein n=1 Tax=Streptomyces chiangmaiensis TaxID=766497 RepID=A0ABU7FRL9_9ACTN|nr:cysteine desulfurase family protein [Streptomyces chiangmaiensis]MED7826737.1 cysteine desulfurase family protein [Streptomyces chiangmaiensis]